MKAELIKLLLNNSQDRANKISVEEIKRVSDKNISYAYRYRGDWHKPEYDFDELARAKDTEAYMFRAVQKKVNRILVAGYSFVGRSEEAVEYIERRISEIEWTTQKTWTQNLITLLTEMFSQSNSMWVKVRDKRKSSGRNRVDIDGNLLEPVAGYFPLPFERLEFKVKKNGDLKKVLLNMAEYSSSTQQSGNATGPFQKEFFPRDLVHFYANKRTGFVVGTPELYAALDDVALLRRIEENVEDLIETNLFPTYHYKVGSDQHPERYSPEGLKETDIVKKKVSYMSAGSVFVSDHRHAIEAVGSEGRALRIDFYLNYFKNRALAACGTSALDMGEGTSANRSTASTLSKSMLLDIEAMCVIVADFINFFIINELLIEGGFDPLNKEDKVFIQFGIIDKEDKRADQNHYSQLYHGNLITLDEAREKIGFSPWQDEYIDRTHQKMFSEPLTLAGRMTPGSAAGETLAKNPASNIDPESLNKEKTFVKEQGKISSRSSGRPVEKGSSGSRSAASRNNPTNQHGTRATAKTTRDVNFGDDLTIPVELSDTITDAELDSWKQEVLKTYSRMSNSVSLETLAKTMAWRLK